MNGDSTRWAVVLAGGSGSRLNGLTTDATGVVIPKQYCSFFGGPSLLRRTIQRLNTVVDSRRIVVVVSAEHRRWWEPELGDIARENVMVQPCNRGTACGVLLPLMSILWRDQSAQIAVSPSDNFVQDEETLTFSLMEAQAHVDSRPDRLVLLGMKPDHPDAGYGWITPSAGREDAVRVVTSFVEKPDARLAGELMRSGALWSSFTFVATGETLLSHFRRSMPWLVDQFDTRLAYVSGNDRQYALLSLYDRLPTVDFSSRILQDCGDGVHVLPVPPCGWTDLGTPQRVSECALRYGGSPQVSDPAAGPRAKHHGGPKTTPAPGVRRCAVDLAEVALRASQ